MDFLTIKSLHLIFVVTWFAGLFYMFRLFVYYAEADQEELSASTVLKKQYRLMMRRLWYAISWPSAVLTLVFGTWMLILQPGYLSAGYMHIKLGFVLVLYAYQVLGQLELNRILKDGRHRSSQVYRYLNEVPTVILIAVVFLIVKRDAINWIWGVAGILGTAVLLAIAVRWYKLYRTKNS